MSGIIIEVDGQRYTGWTEVSVNKSIENLCGSFMFISTASAFKPFPVKVGQNCRIFVDDILFITGWVEKIKVEFNVDVHSITVSGRDITNDIVDSQLSHVDFNPNSTLKTMTERVLKDLNLSNIKVIDRFNLSKFTDIETDSLGVTAFDFLQNYAMKRQVLLTTNGDGNIVFERASNKKINTVLSTERNNIGTIKSSKVTYDDAKRFNEYLVVGQENTVSAVLFDRSKNAAAASNIEGKAIDKKIRTSRRMVFQPEENGDSGTNQERAKWEANFRRAHGMVYTCTVQGYKPLNDEDIWTLNTLVQIIDEFTNINETNSTLLLTGVEFILSSDDGAITNLTFMTKKAFTTQVNKPEKDSKDFKEGTPFFDRQPQKS